MSKVTAIRSKRGRGERVGVFLDGKFAFSLEAEVALREGLKTGQELSSSQIEQLLGSDRFYRCLNSAHHHLSYRPRSEAELRIKLNRRGFEAETIQAVLKRLKEQGLVDDLAFAQFWKENRKTFSPRSQYLTRLELRQKGVAGEVIEQVISELDDEESAYRAAQSKARRLKTTDFKIFYRRLGDYLKRRGFNYAVINSTVKQVWQESQKTYHGVSDEESQNG